MTNRTLYLLLSLGCFIAGCALFAWVDYSRIARGDRTAARVLAAIILLCGVGTIYFLVSAFSKERYRAISTDDPDYSESTTFYCPHCDAQLNYSQMPAFKSRFPCPKCGQMVTREEEHPTRPAPRAAPEINPPPSPEIPHELATADGAPATEPVTADAVRAALTGHPDFTVADDPGGWLILTATSGPPRWIEGPTPDTMVKHRQIARLYLTRGNLSAIRPEALALTATHPNLCVSVCMALVSTLGTLKVRVLSADSWIPVGADREKLALRLVAQRAALFRLPTSFLPYRGGLN